MTDLKEIEKAIETIKIAIAEVEWNYPMNYAIAFETALEALQQMGERQKGCEYCKGNHYSERKHIVKNSDGFEIIIDTDNTLCTIFDDRLTSPKINFCPNCGRNLRNESEGS